MSEVIYTICALYLLIGILVWLGLLRREESSSAASLTSGSVIICARDEEEDLPACLQSLETQILGSLPTDKIEIILVDDVSQDRTLEIMEQYARASRFSVKVLEMSPPQIGEPSGKWRPLKEGMKLAKNEGLLLTDADAILPPDWMRNHLLRLGSHPLIAGFARIDGKGLWKRVQCLDWLFLLGVGSALNRWGIPQAALGKNLSVRRSDYESVGGLEGIGFSLTEDLSLVQAVVRQRGEMGFPLAADLMVTTPGVSGWGEFVSQRKRWASGVKRLLFAGKVCIAAMALRHFVVVIGMLAWESAALWAWGITALINLLIQLRLTSKLGLSRRLWYFPFWEIFYTWTAPLLALSFLSKRRVVWKGRKFIKAKSTLAN